MAEVKCSECGGLTMEKDGICRVCKVNAQVERNISRSSPAHVPYLPEISEDGPEDESEVPGATPAGETPEGGREDMGRNYQERKCKCGETFIPTGPAQKKCPKCRGKKKARKGGRTAGKKKRDKPSPLARIAGKRRDEATPEVGDVVIIKVRVSDAVGAHLVALGSPLGMEVEEVAGRILAKAVAA